LSKMNHLIKKIKNLVNYKDSSTEKELLSLDSS
jgi:hypothetical protein